MHRSLRRAALSAVVATFVVGHAVALADTVVVDGDIVTPSIQTSRDLGEVPARSTVRVDVGLVLACRNLTHVPRGATLTLADAGGTGPSGGSIHGTSVTIGPVPETWPTDGDGCIDDPELASSDVSHVTIVAPATAGVFIYTLAYSKTPGDGLTGKTSISFRLGVLANSAPTLDLPPKLDVEGDTVGGWTAAFTATATDAEDDPDPPVTCTVYQGQTIPVGTTTVTCSATDSGGREASGSFDVTVRDTTAPVLRGMPQDLTVVTPDPAGTAVAWTNPTAADVVDSAPRVGCDPASAGTLPVGTTQVTCTAVDAAGNSTSDTFHVTVHQAVVTWASPIDGTDAALTGNLGRTVPIKAVIRFDGAALDASAPVRIRLERLATCSGDVVVETRDAGPLTADTSRWNLNLDTTGLTTGCWRATATMNRLALGSFRLTLTSGGAYAAPDKARAGG
ncbi:MAG: HYR domain-containing protein [Chloroflexota bacterium]